MPEGFRFRVIRVTLTSDVLHRLELGISLILKMQIARGMRLTLHTIKAVLAVAVSLWMADQVCVMGCTQSAPASSPRITDSSSSQKTATHHSEQALLEDVPNCHHTGDNPSLPPSERKPASNAPASCCPLEATVIQKSNTVGLRTVTMRDFVLSSDFDFGVARFSGRSEFVRSISHSGRDTLLETYILRI